MQHIYNNAPRYRICLVKKYCTNYKHFLEPVTASDISRSLWANHSCTIKHCRLPKAKTRISHISPICNPWGRDILQPCFLGLQPWCSCCFRLCVQSTQLSLTSLLASGDFEAPVIAQAPSYPISVICRVSPTMLKMSVSIII